MKNKPVNCVTWAQAKVFAAFAGARLPTDAEWEFAARSRGLDDPYPGSISTDSGPQICEQTNVKGRDDGNGNVTSCEDGPITVCQNEAYDQTDQGLCDMGGNLWEWVADVYSGDNQTSPSNGSASTVGTSDSRLLRSGSWRREIEYSHTRRRGNDNLNDAFDNGGFRLASSNPNTESNDPDDTSFCGRDVGSDCEEDIQCASGLCVSNRCKCSDNNDCASLLCVEGACVPCDADGDGVDSLVCGGNDCDDTRPSINPGIAEFCGDGLDNDCDGSTDEAACGCRADADCGGLHCCNGQCLNPNSAECSNNGGEGSGNGETMCNSDGSLPATCNGQA